MNTKSCEVLVPPTSENRYFEDYVLNSVHEFGVIPIEAEAIISFGRQFDP